MSQNELILKDLKQGKTVTPLTALKQHGIMRLGARIYDLSRKGYSIDSKTIRRNGKRYSGYFLAA